MSDDHTDGDLTPKMHKFSMAIVEGDSQSAAYRGAYDATNMKDEAVAVEASRLMRDPRIKGRIDELRSRLQRALGVSRATLLRELDEVKDLARERRDVKSLLAVTMSKARLLGFLDNPAKPTSDSQREALGVFGAYDLDGNAE